MAIALLTLLHLTCLQALGQPYLSSFAPLKIRDLRDVFIRVPLQYFCVLPETDEFIGVDIVIAFPEGEGSTEIAFHSPMAIHMCIHFVCLLESA